MAAALLLVCAVPSLASAQGVRIVNPTADHADGVCTGGDCTLREAIMQDTATEIQLPEELYSLEVDDPLVISRSVTIRGIQDELAIISADSETRRTMTIAPGVSVQLFRLRIAGGNEQNGLGGGIIVSETSSLLVTDSEIVNNRAVSGGGIWSSGSLTLVRTTVADNMAIGVDEDVGRGGGVGLEGTARPRCSPTRPSAARGGRPRRRDLHEALDDDAQRVDRRERGAAEGPPEDSTRVAGSSSSCAAAGRRPVPPTRSSRGTRTKGAAARVNIPIASSSGLLDELAATTPAAMPRQSRRQDRPGRDRRDAGGERRVDPDVLAREHSPAIDAGAACPADDQRGFPRRIFECDIGAYEFGADNFTPDVSIFTDEDTQPGCTVDHCTLRERVQTADDDDVIDAQGRHVRVDGGQPLELEQNLLEFEGAGVDLTTIDANDTSRVGTVEGAEARFTGVTVTGGNADVGDNSDPGQGGAFRMQSRTAAAHGDQSGRQRGLGQGRRGVERRELPVRESIASGNHSSALAGGIYSLSVNDGNSHIENSTVSGNTAGTRGGGVYVGDDSQVDHVTITGNSAVSGAGLLVANNEGPGVYGSLVAGNAGPECGVEGLFDGDHNLADDTTCGFDEQGDLQGVDARLAPLGNYGGPTRTHALYTGSPALDAGGADRCPAEDQRGIDRPDGPCDIGAFEGSIAPPSPPSGGGGNQPPPDDELPEPEAGKTVNVLPEGTVKVKLPGRNRFRTLSEGEQCRSGRSSTRSRDASPWSRPAARRRTSMTGSSRSGRARAPSR